MPSLRTAFVQTCNPNNSMFSYMQGMMASLGCIINNEETEKKLTSTEKENMRIRKWKSLLYFPETFKANGSNPQNNENQKSMSSNNLHHLLDNERSDFKEYENFVHTLELQEEEELKLLLIESTETVQSLRLESDGIELYSPHSTRNSMTEISDIDSEMSEVEALEI